MDRTILLAAASTASGREAAACAVLHNELEAGHKRPLDPGDNEGVQGRVHGYSPNYTGSSGHTYGLREGSNHVKRGQRPPEQGHYHAGSKHSALKNIVYLL